MSAPNELAVRLLTIIFTPIAAGLTGWAAKQGLNLPAGDVVTVSVGAGASVLGLGFHWLQRQPAVLKAEEDLDSVAEKVAAKIKGDPALAAPLADLAVKLDAQRDDILKRLAELAHVPSPVESVLQQLLDAAAQQRPAHATSTPAPSPPIAAPPAS